MRITFEDSPSSEHFRSGKLGALIDAELVRFAHALRVAASCHLFVRDTKTI